jgi:hypothetical protein
MTPRELMILRVASRHAWQDSAFAILFISIASTPVVVFMLARYAGWHAAIISMFLLALASTGFTLLKPLRIESDLTAGNARVIRGHPVLVFHTPVPGRWVDTVLRIPHWPPFRFYFGFHANPGDLVELTVGPASLTVISARNLGRGRTAQVTAVSDGARSL